MTGDQLKKLISQSLMAAEGCEALYRGREAFAEFADGQYSRFRYLEHAYARIGVLIGGEFCVVFVSGSDDRHDWIDNLSASQSWLLGLRVHAGFAKIADMCEKEIRKASIQELKDRPIIFVGHSSGGAIAEILAYVFPPQPGTAQVITFGQPRVFSACDVAAYRAYPWETFRFVLEGDLVPLLPLRSFRWLYGRAAYAHTQDAIYVDPDTGEFLIDRSPIGKFWQVLKLAAGWTRLGIGYLLSRKIKSIVSNHSITKYRAAMLAAQSLYQSRSKKNA